MKILKLPIFSAMVIIRKIIDIFLMVSISCGTLLCPLNVKCNLLGLVNKRQLRYPSYHYYCQDLDRCCRFIPCPHGYDNFLHQVYPFSPPGGIHCNYNVLQLMGGVIANDYYNFFINTNVFFERGVKTYIFAFCGTLSLQ